MRRKIEFFYDIGSPYSYIAATQIGKLAAIADIEWRPFLLGGVFKASGNQPPIAVPARAPYLLKDLHRLANYYGLPFRMPQKFPTNSLTAMRALYAVDPAALEATSMALFEAYWVDNRDIGDDAVLRELLGSPLVDRAASDEVKLKLKEATDEAVMRGAFGAPTFFVDEEMFFGEDRLFLIEHYLKNDK